MILPVVLSLVSFFIFLVLHFVIFHTCRLKRRFRALVFILLFSILIYSCLYFIIIKSGFKLSNLDSSVILIFNIIGGVFAYCFFAYFYFTHFVLVARSITTRFMVDILLSPHKRLSKEELRRGFSFEKKLSTELEDMEIIGRIIQDGNFFRNTKKGRIHAMWIKFFRNYLHVGYHK